MFDTGYNEESKKRQLTNQKKEKTMFTKLNKQLAAIGAAYTTGMILARDAAAQGQDADTFMQTLIGEIDTLPGFISTVMYILGILLAIAGIYKLKEAVDNPGQNSIQDGFIRLAAGGALIALPTLVATMAGTLGQGAAVDNTGEFALDGLAAITP